ncbi:glycosyltransferase family 2 protein [Candidatus Parcubacteria bacterium]|jgi:GT2 family glycosyltransferase|nr:MAG: glycosyltransferase family 2 protein [Candidatus Parcubacteria bacterium]
MNEIDLTYDISLVSWNSEPWLEKCLRALKAQTIKPKNIFVVDNNSQDGSLKVLKQFSEVQVFPQNANLGFAKAHNLNISKSSTDFILALNPDVVLEADYAEKLLDFARNNPRAAALVGSIFSLGATEIDTAGLKITIWRKVKEIKKLFSEPTQIFGVSGAVAMLRRNALEQIKVNAQFLNEAFFAYKEDIELAWRLRWAGWQAFCIPQAKAQHFRVLKTEAPRKTRAAERRRLSYRNQLLLYPSVESLKTFLPHAWAILPAEIFRLVFLLLTDYKITVSALAEVRKMWHDARTFAREQPRLIKAKEVRAAF